MSPMAPATLSSDKVLSAVFSRAFGASHCPSEEVEPIAQELDREAGDTNALAAPSTVIENITIVATLEFAIPAIPCRITSQSQQTIVSGAENTVRREKHTKNPTHTDTDIKTLLRNARTKEKT